MWEQREGGERKMGREGKERREISCNRGVGTEGGEGGE